MPGPVIRRLYYSVSEVSNIVGVHPHVLRQWENKFPDLKPAKSKSGRRLFKENDIELIRRIKKLRENGYTIKKIKELIQTNQSDNFFSQATVENHMLFSERKIFHETIQALQEILGILNTQQND
jgi:DNA-binding transcriptional MerR regulator